MNGRLFFKIEMMVCLGGVLVSLFSACTPPHRGGEPNAEMNPDAAPWSVLPLTALTASEEADFTLPMVVYLSGDGGWNAFSSGLAQTLARAGLPVVGLDALRYFRRRKSPQRVADDLAAVIGHYQAEWQRDSVVLIGYSFGGSVMPYAYNRLPPDLRTKVSKVVLMSPTEHADFKIHLRNLLALDGSDRYPIAPEVAKIHDASVLFLFGREEASEWLTKTSNRPPTLEVLPGGHHYAQDYPLLTQTIVEHVASQSQ